MTVAPHRLALIVSLGLAVLVPAAQAAPTTMAVRSAPPQRRGPLARFAALLHAAVHGSRLSEMPRPGTAPEILEHRLTTALARLEYKPIHGVIGLAIAEPTATTQTSRHIRRLDPYGSERSYTSSEVVLVQPPGTIAPGDATAAFETISAALENFEALTVTSPARARQVRAKIPTRMILQRGGQQRAVDLSSSVRFRQSLIELHDTTGFLDGVLSADTIDALRGE